MWYSTNQRFRPGAARSAASPHPSRTTPGGAAPTSIELFKEYQTKVGVKLVHRRQFYGLRRALSAFAEDVQTDERVLNELTGWKDSATRRGYQKRQSAKVLNAAAETRHSIREGILRKVHQEPDAEAKLPAPLPDLSSLSFEQLQALIEAARGRLETVPNTTRKEQK